MNLSMLQGKSRRLMAAESVAYQKALDEARRTIRELTEGKAFRDLKIGELKEDNRQAVDTVKQLEFSLEILENTVERLDRELQNKDATVDGLQRCQRAGVAERQGLRSLLAKRNGELGRLKQEVAAMERNQALQQEASHRDKADQALLLQTAEEMETLLHLCHDLGRENGVLRKEAEWFWRVAPNLKSEVGV